MVATSIALKNLEHDLPNLAELNKLVAEADTVQCRYCFNLDHWIPVQSIVTEVDCRLCNVCPMYVRLADWDEHKDHGDDSASPVIKCAICPSCNEIIAPNDPVALCRFCEKCQSYIPVADWERHLQDGCYGLNDIFA